jgi:SWI/SNF-related matrix-associated actin-dependent regulator of chromatin subfamily B protein 1
VVTPDIFAQSLVEDYNLSSNDHHIITKSIQEQLADFHGQAFTPADNAHSTSDNRNEMHEETRGTLNGALDASEGRWWAKWRKKVKREARRAVEEADSLKGGRRRKSGINKREGTKQNGGLRKRRKTAVAEVKKEDRDNDTDMLADNEMDGEDDGEWGSDTVKENSDDEYDEWKPLSLEEIKINEQNMHDDMRILIKVSFGLSAANKGIDLS